MNARTGYRIAYAALVLGLLFACAPAAQAPETPVAEKPPETPPEDFKPVAPVTAEGPAPTDAVQPMSAPSSAPAPAAPAPQATAPAAATPDELASGAAVYARACIMCHGPAGVGIPGGPPKVTGLKDFAAVRRVTAAGDKNMPPMSGLLSAHEIDDVSKFIVAGLPQQ